MALDSLWIGIAFLLGFLMRYIKMPPMLGFLFAGFVISGLGLEHGKLLDDLADMGVMLLLFTIGLKLKVKSLTEGVVWGGGLLAAILTTVLFSLFLTLAHWLNIPKFNTLSFEQIALIAFALSFSSTVFVVKILEEQGTINTSEGKVAVGVLIIQDILAVVFLTISKEGWPSPWAFLLVLSPALRFPLLWLLRKTGHGEMLILFGFFVAVIGGELFEIVGLKSDLGALVFGMILSNNKKSNELAKTLLNFKDFFLIAFFLNIGFFGMPSLSSILVATILALVLIVKPFIFHFSFTRFKFPVRSSYFAAISLTNYSEFGLIVAVLATKMGWISAEWLITIVLAISLSFVISSFLNEYSVKLFEVRNKFICSFGKSKDYTRDNQATICDAEVFIFGMGRIGSITYDNLNKIYPDHVLGLDSDETVVENQVASSRKVILHDATDTEFWDNVCKDGIGIVVLAMSDFKANMFALKLINTTESKIKIFAAARFDDEVKQLQEAGAHHVFNIVEEAGKGLVNDILSKTV